ncbi:DUF6801 domain-containing protein [Aeromicrobium sp. HA]|uniref:DUF6801 domain-containing protein n=1 Tax=Aeromicrobium sp. HA TaxID=3009077 RepID=UPI0022AFC6CB|nr:DUF6801 domain-containing protein [Aeromicrobium sp. HA]
MIRTSRTSQRLVAAGSSAAALAAAAVVGVGLVSPASAADVELEKSFDYTCQVTAGGLNLGEHVIGVLASTTAPESVSPGEVIAPRTVNITLTMPELLRQSTAMLLQGREADGESTDSAVTLTTGGETTSVPIPNLGSPRTPIPQTANEPWTIPASGTVPEITTPATATGSVVLGMPSTFSIAATIYKADDSTVPSTLTCAGPGDLSLGTIAVTAGSEPTTGPTSEPTTEPTSEPTTEPTSEPTTEPTSEPTTTPTTTPTDPPADDVDLSKRFDYTCRVTAGGLDLGSHVIGVLAETTIPSRVQVGDVISSRGVDITLTLPELLRQSTAMLLQGREAEGGSTDSSITLTTGGQTQAVAIQDLKSARTPIPQVADEPWLIPATGTVPEITVPEYAETSVRLGMPEAFTIQATIHKADGSTVPSNLTCAGPDELGLGSIPVGDAEPEPTTGPTSQPTTAPTTQPTTEPTGEPTTAPTTGPGDDEDPDAVELLSDDVLSPGDTITFAFGSNWIGKELEFELRSDPIPMGTKVVPTSGEVSVRIPTNAPAGSHDVVVLSRGEVIASVPVEILPADAAADTTDDDWVSDGYLAATGGPAVSAALLGGVLVLAGGAALVLRRRTRRS